MTYCHLLSRRTALLRSIALVGALATSACSDDSFSPIDSDPTLPASAAKLFATTDNPVVGPGRSTVLRAITVDKDGLRRSLDAQWKSLDGGAVRDTVINDEQVTVFSSPDPGNFRLVGVSTNLGASDTTMVIVPSLAQTSSIVKLVLTPTTAELRTNDTLRYSVYGLTATGEQVPAAVSLHPDRGWAIGLKYVTPITGRFMVRAILEGGGVADTSFVNVTTTAPLQPAPGTEPAPTEPVPTEPVEIEPTPVQSGSVARIVMSPTQALLRVNDTLRFRVWGLTSTGDSVPVSATLKPDRGYAIGYKYVTPITGTFRVRAILNNSTLADTAVVTVTTTAPLQPAPGTEPAPTEPAPTEPAPTEPAPTEPAPTEPTPEPEPAPAPSPSGSAELPRTFLDTRMVSPTGKVIYVAAGGNLQTAINSAVRGDVIELAAGAVFTGNYQLPAKSGSGWVTIRTRTTLPPEGTRVTASSASSFAKIVTPNSMPALYPASSAAASYYRIVGVEFRSSASMTYSIVNLSDYARTTTSPDQLASHIVLDRVWIHGHSTQTIYRCLTLNVRSTAIIDSRLSDCHVKGGDSQAIFGYEGPGPFKIVNNYIEGAGENIMFGGADPKYTGLVPSDIEIRRNHIVKPLTWKSSGAWSIKNLLEFKNARRVLIEGNVFENNWADAQTGFAIVLKSANQSGRCTWCVTEDVTFRYNRVINSPGGMTLAAVQAENGGGAIPANSITIQHNTFEKVGLLSQSGNRRIFQLLGGLADIVIEHNSALGEDIALLFDGGPVSRLTLRNNMLTRGRYGIFGSGKGEGAGALAYYAPSSSVTRNIVVAAPSSQYPTGNYYPSTLSAAGVSTTDLSLLSTSPYRTSATDGTMIGADVVKLLSVTSGVR